MEIISTDSRLDLRWDKLERAQAKRERSAHFDLYFHVVLLRKGSLLLFFFFCWKKESIQDSVRQSLLRMAYWIDRLMKISSVIETSVDSRSWKRCATFYLSTSETNENENRLEKARRILSIVLFIFSPRLVIIHRRSNKAGESFVVGKRTAFERQSTKKNDLLSRSLRIPSVHGERERERKTKNSHSLKIRQDHWANSSRPNPTFNSNCPITADISMCQSIHCSHSNERFVSVQVCSPRESIDYSEITFSLFSHWLELRSTVTRRRQDELPFRWCLRRWKIEKRFRLDEPMIGQQIGKWHRKRDVVSSVQIDSPRRLFLI